MEFKIEFTPNAIEAINGSQKFARELGHDHVGSEHILLAILSNPLCQACRRLERLGHKADELSQALRTMIEGGGAGVLQRGPVPLTARARKIIDMAAMMAMEEKKAGTPHLVLAMLREGENAAAQLLFNVGVTAENFSTAGNQEGEPKPADGGDAAEKPEDGNAQAEERQKKKKEPKTPTLNTFGRDLTELARDGKLDPVVGREKELSRLVQILSRRTKNNAVLIGEAGVGKTAVVEGLAQAIARCAVPEKMQSKRVVSVDMARVVAGTQYRGQFEERLKRIVDETKRSGDIILFLDEIHTLVGAGGAEGAMDAANILKPALARGELQCVGATTMKEYHKSIEKDAALERRFQSVQVDEPSIDDTVRILEGIAGKYEEFHLVKFGADALRAAVELTARYIPSRQLPDKAIDAIDETGARLRMSVSERPSGYFELQDELACLKKSKDEAVAGGDFDMAAEFRDKMREIGDKADALLAEWKKTHVEKVLDAAPSDVAATVSSMSGVPVEKMNATTAGKLLNMEKTLSAAVVGQDPAISAISKALRRSRAFVSDPKRPIGGFLFLGPTGVGKTHLAKMLAEKIYGDEKALITLDMSEYQEKYSSSRLVGAPPGYVGYDEGGQLTEKVRRRPYSIVLFDEFEKANQDVCNMLLQILDDGRLTDGQGRVVDFRNTIVICTANLGFDFARTGKSIGFSPAGEEDGYEKLKERLEAEAKKAFRPELLNRFDDIVVFRKLEKTDMLRILDMELDRLRGRLGQVSLSLGPGVAEFLVDKGYDSALGARPLRRVVQRWLEDPLAEMMLAGKAKSGVKAKMSEDGENIKFSELKRKENA